MNTLNMKEVYKTFYSTQRGCSELSEGSSFVAYNSAMSLIGDAFICDDKEQALIMLFNAKMAATKAFINKSEPEFNQSEKLTAALAKFRGGVQ